MRRASTSEYPVHDEWNLKYTHIKRYLEHSLNLITSCNMLQAACAIRVYPFAFRSKITKICMAIWTTFFDVNLWQFKTSF